jgi:hypothetical protein
MTKGFWEMNAKVPVGLINWSLFLRALYPPLLIWVLMAAFPILSGQPGVVCFTPMAWLLGTWCGLRYISLSNRQPGQHPLLGAALAGGILGVAEGIFFILVTTFYLPPSTPDDVSKIVILDLVMFVGSTIFCAGSSSFTALLTLKRLAREQGSSARQAGKGS